MLLLAYLAHRTRRAHADLAEMILRGDAMRAAQIGLARLESSEDRHGKADRGVDDALLGQLIGHCLLACGLEGDADEHLRSMRRLYERVSRTQVRTASALDQGVVAAHMNRHGRAAEAYCAVADDAQAPTADRVQAMLGAALSMHRTGECVQAWHTLDAARRLAESMEDDFVTQLVEVVGLEMATLQRQRASVALEDHALSTIYREGTPQIAEHEVLLQQLGAAARSFSEAAPIVVQRMSQLANLLEAPSAGLAATTHLSEGLEWLRRRRMAAFEAEYRMESALSLVSVGAVRAAGELLAPLGQDEPQVRRNRHSMELEYCLAKIRMSQGRHVEALRLFNLHSQEAVHAMRQEASRRKPSAYLNAAPAPRAAEKQIDATCARLPLRYRRAYEYIVLNLHNDTLSVHQVALHVGVTERALQLAFRQHLGLTPAELIRNRRMERIREELCARPGDESVLELAKRWGIKSRTTLVNNYRSRFAETPMQTLRGGETGASMHAE